ncbi:MAG: hypothetical protein QW486_05420 [Candidatus Bathyarchaeia archaeon]
MRLKWDDPNFHYQKGTRLSCARGFSSSPNSPTPHRIRFPLAFNPWSGLGTTPGRTLGFASQIQDTYVCEYIWPAGASGNDPTKLADLFFPPPPVGCIILNTDEAQLLVPLILLLQATFTTIIAIKKHLITKFHKHNKS